MRHINNTYLLPLNGKAGGLSEENREADHGSAAEDTPIEKRMDASFRKRFGMAPDT